MIITIKADEPIPIDDLLLGRYILVREQDVEGGVEIEVEDAWEWGDEPDQ